MGINARNGHVCYFCDGGPAENGCSADAAEKAAVGDCGLTDEDDVIVVRRVSHAVKALKTRTGEQRWNYSVAQNHLRLEEGPGISVESHFHRPHSSSKGDVIITTCDKPSTVSLADLRFDVLDGRVIVGGGKSSSSNGKPRYFDFKVPIANAWLVSAGKLVSINLFDAKYVGSSARNDGPSNFLTYLGSFNNQYYLQHSTQIHDLVALRNGRKTGNRELEWQTIPGSVACREEEKKKPLGLTYVDKMTPASGKTRFDHKDSKEVAIRTPTLAAGAYLRPANEYQLEVGKLDY